MPLVKANGVDLFYELSGPEGAPTVAFSNSIGSTLEMWDAQVAALAGRYRCLRYDTRGHGRSDTADVATTVDDLAADLAGLLDALGIAKAHVVGLSQGAFATAHFGRLYSDRALSLTLAGVGSGAGREGHEQFKKDAVTTAQRIRKEGMAKYADGLTTNPTRSRFKQKDPRGFAEFVKNLSEHPDLGAANTMENYQGKRPSLYDFEAEWKKLDLPTLIICGDEDEPCLQPSLYLKRVLPNAGLALFAKTGHTVNLEEPDAFNREVWNFITLAEAGKWLPAQPMAPGASLI